MFFNNNIPLHASGVIHPNDINKALLVFGPSGSGKSTLTWLLCQSGFVLLSDDNIISDMNGNLFGSGGDLLVRPDFLNIYGISTGYKEVSPNQKYSISVENIIAGNVQPKAVLIPKVDTQTNNNITIISPDEALIQIKSAHIGWTFSDKEKD